MTPELAAIVDGLSADAPPSLDLTQATHLRMATAGADALLEAAPTDAALRSLERSLFEPGAQTPLLVHLASKLALSKRLLARIDRPARLSVSFAMYKEHQRILTVDEHPHGEDFLRRKAEQLDWLVEGSSVDWRLLAVDDGCPEGSGLIAQELVDRYDLGDRVSVLFLEDAIRAGHPVVQPMTSASDSQKGGSIQLGMWTAAQDEHPHHVVAFTDADLSTHLGQSGLLMHPILVGGADAALGSRREPTSVAIKKGTRNVRGKLFIYLWKRLLPELGRIVDTQCGFKGFRADTARRIVVDAVEKRFAFDIELLLRTELARPGSAEKVAVAWIDSEAASTTTDLQPYLAMLKSTAGFYRRYLTENTRSEAFAAFIEGLDEAAWDRLLDAVPGPIAGGDPNDFSKAAPVAVADLQAVLDA